jgi:hypothetical protein
LSGFVKVKRRLVIYVQGYDPRGLAEYYRMFRREYRRSCELYGLTGEIGRAENDPHRHITSWNVTTHSPTWRVETRYMFLRWDDIIRRDFARPVWWKIARMPHVFSDWIRDGTLVRFFKAHWRFGLFAFYPFVLLAIWLVLAAGAGVAIGFGFDALGITAVVSGIVGVAVAAATFAGLLWFTERYTYLLYLCDDAISTHQFAHRQRPDWEKRMGIFASYVADAVKNSKANEAIVVGHSSGSFLAVDVLDRALERNRDFSRGATRVRLLTIGANLPIIGFQPVAQWFRERLRRVATATDIAWVDYQSRHDVMNFWPFDPITGHGIVLGKERRNLLVIPVSFRDLWRPGTFDRRRWRFFSAHFQFLRANEQRGAAYDYYLICCGPVDLVTRATKPAQAVAAILPQSEQPAIAPGIA